MTRYTPEQCATFTDAVGRAADQWQPSDDHYPIEGGELPYVEMAHRLSAIVRRATPELPRDSRSIINANIGLVGMSLFMYRCAYKAALANLTLEETKVRLLDHRTTRTLHHIASLGNMVATAMEIVYGLQESPLDEEGLEALGTPPAVNDLVVTPTHFANPMLQERTAGARQYLSEERLASLDSLRPAMCPMQAARQVLPCFHHIVTIGVTDLALVPATLRTYASSN